MHNKKIKIIYSFDNIDPSEGIDVFQVGPLLTSLGELIKESNRLVGTHHKDIGINVKPFSEGSFIQELVLYAPDTYEAVKSLISNNDVQTIKEVLEWIGIIGGSGFSLFKLIKFLNGRWEKIEEVGPDEYRYYAGDDNSVTVNAKVHALVQNVKIQQNIKQVFYTIPKNVDPDSTSITTYDADSPDSTKVHFGEDEIKSIGIYAEQELSDVGKDENSSKATLYLKPKQGSYRGDRGPYSFFYGDGRNVLSNVTIEDPEFLKSLNEGRVRLHTNDVIKAEVITVQRVDINNEIYAHHTITHVLDYREGSSPYQSEMFDNKDTQ